MGRRQTFPIAVVCLALLAGCARGTTVRASKDRVVVGGIGNFSGDGSDTTRAILRGAELAISEYNENPDNPFRAETKLVDTKGTTDGTSKAAKDLIATARIVGAVGPFRADQLTIAGPIFDGSALPFVIPSVTDPDIGGWRSFRRLVANDSLAGEAAGADAAARSRRGTIAVLYDEGPLSVAAATGAKKAIEEAKANLTHFDKANAKTDIAAVTKGLAGESPAVALFFGPLDRAAQFAGGLKAANYTGRIMVGRSARDKKFTETVGNGGDGILGTSVSADLADPKLKTFVARHQRKFGRLPAPFAAEAYEGTLMLLEALQEVEPPPSPGEITDFLSQARVFLGDTKTYTYNDKGEPAATPIWVLELKAGRWHLVGKSRDIRPKPGG